MTVSTRTKILLARTANRGVMAARRLAGLGPIAAVRRRGINWVLDLAEGIDFAIYLTGGFEPTTMAAYRRLLRPGDIALDIGANMGAHTLPMARLVGETGRVAAFEPTAGAHARLTTNVAANPDLAERIAVLQMMLTRDGAVPPPPAIYASWPMRSVPASHPRHLGVPVSTEGARALPLDQALAEAGITAVKLIKMDVDGYEMDVLTGAEETLRRRRPAIIMELAPYTWQEHGEAVDGPVALLQDLGYRFHTLKMQPIPDGRQLVRDIPPGHSINVIAIPDAG